MSFAKLKRRKTDFEALQKKFETKSSKSFDDPRFYYPDRDDQGNAVAELRFLPTNDAVDDAPFVKYYLHKFQGPGGWFWQNCRTSIGESDCPVCDANRQLVEQAGGKWDAVPESVKQIVRNRKRQQVFVANVYVVRDKAKPENEGKVFLFKFGSTIMDMIKSAINPEFEDEKQFNPFDPWHGANFNFKIRKVDGQVKYDKSTWGDVGPLFKDDDAIEELSKKLFDLGEFVAPEAFKSFEEQVKVFERVSGGTKSRTVPQSDNTKPAVAETKTVGKTEERVSPPATDETSQLEKLFSGSDDEAEDDIPF